MLLDFPKISKKRLEQKKGTFVGMALQTLRGHYDNVTRVRVRTSPMGNNKADEYTIHHPSFDPSQAHLLGRMAFSNDVTTV